MKIKKIFPLILLVSLSVLLSACSGSAMTTNSWPGVTVDPDGETLYIANNTFIHALQLSNGTEKWRYPAEADNKVTYFAPPTIANNGQLILPSYDSNLYSLDPETRTPNWTFGEANNKYIASALALEDRILAADSDNSLYSLNLTGELEWTFETEHSLWAAPAFDGQIIYLPSMDHYVYAIQAGSGELSWKTEDLGGAIVSTPILKDDGVLFVGTFASEVIALDTKQQGKILWRLSTDGWVWSAGLLRDDTLYVGDLAGSLFALDVQTGELKWKFTPTGIEKPGISGAPAIIDDTLFFVTEGGSLFALDWANGGQKWSKQFQASFYPGPIAVADTILLAPTGGEELVIALDINGNQKWAFIPAK